MSNQEQEIFELREIISYEAIKVKSAKKITKKIGFIVYPTKKGYKPTKVKLGFCK